MLTLRTKTSLISENDIEELVDTAVTQIQTKYELQISEHVKRVLKNVVRISNICYIYTPQVCFECLMYVLEEYRISHDFTDNNFKVTLDFAMNNYTSLIQPVDTYRYHDDLIDSVVQLSNVVFNQAVLYYLMNTQQISTNTDCLSATELTVLVDKIEDYVKQIDKTVYSYRSNTEVNAFVQREFEMAKRELNYIEDVDNNVSPRMIQILE